MPQIETWSRLHAALRDHLVERMHDRNITLQDLNQLRLWMEAKPEAPEGSWYKDFGIVEIFGEGQVAQNVSSCGPTRGWATALELWTGASFVTDSDIWIGLARLKANPKVKNFRRFGKGKGAYVNVVAWAESKAAFEKKVKRHAEGMDCILVELEEVQLLESRMNAPHFPAELVDLRQTANRQPSDTAFGTFHIWHQEDAN